jgi:hypothetical protein
MPVPSSSREIVASSPKPMSRGPPGTRVRTRARVTLQSVGPAFVPASRLSSRLVFARVEAGWKTGSPPRLAAPQRRKIFCQMQLES